MVGVEVGNIMDRRSEEFYASSVIELPVGAVLSRISWEADIPKKTWVSARIRTADSRDALENAKFIGPDGTEKTCYTNGEKTTALAGKGRYVQYQLALGAINSTGTPRIYAVTLEH